MTDNRFTLIVSQQPDASNEWTVGAYRTHKQARDAALAHLMAQPTSFASVIATYGNNVRLVATYELRGSSQLHPVFTAPVRASNLPTDYKGTEDMDLPDDENDHYDDDGDDE